MKLLLNENLPVRLSRCFSSKYQVESIRGLGWSGVKNGELLSRMSASGHNILITVDKGISHQQNLEKHGIVVFVILSYTNHSRVLESAVSKIEEKLPPKVGFGFIEIDIRG